MTKIKVLFVAANPQHTDLLRLDKEIRGITEKIRLAEYRDLLELIPCLATRPSDLMNALNRYKPHIVHFSGHGNPSSEIMLVDDDDRAKPVNAGTLKELFTTQKDNIRVIVLNACYTYEQAEVITQIIDCAIGMDNAISDQAAIKFSIQFYSAIGYGRSLQDAFSQARVAVLFEGAAEENTLKLRCKMGIDPSKIYLIGSSIRANPQSAPYGYLCLRYGERWITVFELRSDKVTIGRHPSSDFRIPDDDRFPRVSNEHAVINRFEKNIFIEDRPSKNGTFVDGQRITQPTFIQYGQIITLGDEEPNELVCTLMFSQHPCLKATA